ncbi:MAG: hypothetical protein B7X04_03710 [Parcubacteria group bacterium 21-54-25]|nr:MAG: hypothetical protein B7X04_03710 [Parcubacteria group bacterium 21-54-25]
MEGGGYRKARGCGVQNRVRSNFQHELLDAGQIVRRTQEMGLFQIQNPLPQGFDPILSSAFKIFQSRTQSGERAHE